MNNLTTYINANIMLLSALSCVTLTDSELPAISNGQIYNNSIIPSINTSFSWENNTPYSVKNVAISTETVLVKTSDYEDFEIISSFAQKLLITEDELKKYLPKYLSEENYNNLLTELKSFPYNIDNRMYTYSLDNNIIYQGDGIKEMPIIDLANIGKGVKITNCLILSNTCDMDIANNRLFPASIMYAPIINLANYISVLQKQGVDDTKIKNHVTNLKQQKITQIIYLPANSRIDDSIVFLDRIQHIDNRYIDRNLLETKRLFSLSDYGFYMLIFKLSVHFSRIQEKVNRGSSSISN